MRSGTAWLVAALLVFAGVGTAPAAGLVDKVKVQLDGAVHQPGMRPGTYVCSAGHLHVRGTVQNQATVTLGPIKLAGKALDAQGKVLGAATGTPEEPTLKPGQTADFDLEFVTVTGSLIKQVKKHEVSVVDAPVAR